MFLVLLANAVLTITYILTGSLSGGLVVLGALVRAFVYFLYSKFNKKPNVFIMLFFQVYSIVITAVFWQGYIDLLMLFNIIIVNYVNWQDNLMVYRGGHVTSALLLIPYDILLGAYTTGLTEVFIFISSLVALIKYRKRLTDTLGGNDFKIIIDAIKKDI